MSFNSAQEQFWAKTYAEDYIRKNSEFDRKSGAEAWKKMLQESIRATK